MITTNLPYTTATQARIRYVGLLRILCAGMLFPLGFAPFHLPGIALISLAFFYHELMHASAKKSLYTGLTLGTGMFGTGVSWVIVSIHEYGQLNYPLSMLITAAFILYLSLFPACMALCFYHLNKRSKIPSALLFAILWVLSEYLRATLFTGFPWLRLGTGLIDTPLRYLAPVTGIYGLSFSGCLAATLLWHINPFSRENKKKQPVYVCALVSLLLIPLLLKSVQWTKIEDTPISTAIIQANLSMRQKWDEALFEQLMEYYSKTAHSLFGTQLIVMPESALPVPFSYIKEYLEELSIQAQKKGSAVITGILHAEESHTPLFNTMLALGLAEGKYDKQHLVPFGEFIPKPFKMINTLLSLPDPDIQPGKEQQPLITLGNHAMASLICYEIAYQELLRTQARTAKWIVSISDNGWFGHSLAPWQQVQMAQMLSLLTGRYQAVSNNDGLSSIINNQGEIVQSLPPFSAGILQSTLYPAEGLTPWMLYGDMPILLLCLMILCISLVHCFIWNYRKN